MYSRIHWDPPWDPRGTVLKPMIEPVSGKNNVALKHENVPTAAAKSISRSSPVYISPLKSSVVWLVSAWVRQANDSIYPKTVNNIVLIV